VQLFRKRRKFHVSFNTPVYKVSWACLERDWQLVWPT
jgi:hypothetical protein